MRKGFTILELLAATALTALLMVVVLHVISSLGRSRAALARQVDGGAWRANLLDTLRHDLCNASTASFRQDGITLAGHGALDRNTLAHGHEPVTVTYGLTTIHGRRWLVRSQARRDGASNEPWAELLCPDVSAFTAQPAGSIVLAPPDSSQDGPPIAAVPPAVSVWVDGAGGRIVNETLVLR
jgi:prepilin-type N-terminal cleavage/methylation domain-containing protein